jgi:adenylate cyclase
MAQDFSKLRHDLRTPLNQLLGYSEMLLEDAPEKSITACELQAALDECKQLLSLVTKVAIDGATMEVIRRELSAPAQKIAERTIRLQVEVEKSQLNNLLPDVKKIVTAAHNFSSLLKNIEIGVLKEKPANSTFSFLSDTNLKQRLAGQKPGRILVVDDSEPNRDMLTRRLEREGHKVNCAETGEQALVMLAQSEFDLVLLDILMPGMDGYQVLKAMKDDNILRHLPVIMLSALDEIESVVRCIELGAEDYLPKPFNPVLLKARIGACLEKKHLRDQEQEILKQLKVEQEKSDRLLLNVLPNQIATRLKQGESTIADYFQEVTILFADLVGFTNLSRYISPVEVVHLLNEMFSGFDILTAKHGLEKIKTIGDAYMAVGGLPAFRSDHAEAIAELALDIQKDMNRFNAEYGTQVQIRIGINTGPVIAGVIGKNKFAYDLWGDTVNTASRMESHSIPSAIQVSEETYSRLKNKYVFQDRGQIDVKGKDKMQTYLLHGRKVFPG